MIICRCLCGHQLASHYLKFAFHHVRRDCKVWSFAHVQTQRQVDESWCRQSAPSYLKSKYLICWPTDISPGTYWVDTRHFHSSLHLQKDESKLEQTVKVLKEKLVEKEKIEKISEVEVKKSLWRRAVDEVKHYYHGFRLLFIDIRVCMRLMLPLLNGTSLSRREHRQLVRTTADLFRLVPFLVFIVVPFMEFLLPVALKLFPNMLPSTFKEKKKEQEKMKKQLKIKLEMAKFLQDTIEESALQGKKSKKKESLAGDFSTFMNKVRSTGAQVSTEEIIKFSKLFEDEITLDNMSRAQLQALCRVLLLPTLGTNNFLRFQLRMRLRQLKADDRMIQKEGIDSLTVWELQAACRARGMRALGVPEDRLKNQLEQWLVLHLHEKLPTSLLLLSRALYLPETLSTADQLQATISSLPETTAEEAKIKVAELSGEQVDNKTKLELIKLEEAAIRKEKEELEAEEKVEEEEKEKREREAAEIIAAKYAMESELTDELLKDQAEILEAKAEEDVTEKISSKDLEEFESALEEIAEEKKLSIEEEELEDLKEEVSEYKEDLRDLKEVILATGGSEKDLKESKAARRLTKRVDKLILQVNKIVEELHQEKASIQEQIDVGEVRMKRSNELQEDEGMRKEMIEEISKKKGNVLSINEMLLALKRLQKMPDETRVQHIFEVLDEDQDGQINLSHILKVIELLGRENVKLNRQQMTEVIELLKQEAILQEEEKLKEKEEKELCAQDDMQETKAKL